MNTDTITMNKVHQGHNVKRLRDMLGMKQETLAAKLNVTQQTLSKLEQKEEVGDEMLEKIAKELNVPVEAFKTMNDEATINLINSFNDNNGHGVFSNNISCSFNPIEKIVELYERLVKAEQEKNALLEERLKER